MFDHLNIHAWVRKDIEPMATLLGLNDEAEKEFISLLSERPTLALVVEKGSEMLGFMVCRLLKTSLEVEHFVIDPKYRKYYDTIASQMWAKLVSMMFFHSKEQLSLLVAEENYVLQLFFAEKRRKNGKSNQRLLRR